MPPAGSRVFLTVRLVWYVTFSVTRETAFDPFPGREVGRGRLDAVPGTPVAVGAPELSSVRCELDHHRSRRIEDLLALLAAGEVASTETPARNCWRRAAARGWR